jgi:hypothetical protein
MRFTAKGPWAALLIVCIGLACAPATLAEDDALEIIKKAFEAADANRELAELYVFRERVETRMLSKKGNVKKQESKTWDVTLLDGSVYKRLVAIDDEPLSEKKDAKEQRKLEKEVEKLRNELPAQREKRLAKVEEERSEGAEFLEEITRAFDFRIVGEEQLAGVDTWVIDAEPRPGYEPTSKQARVLSKVRCKFWIAKDDYGWVKADIDTFEPFSWSVIKIKPGAKISFTQQRVNDEVWLMDTWEVAARARAVLVIGFNGEFEGSYSDFRKFTTSTDVVETSDAP